MLLTLFCSNSTASKQALLSVCRLRSPHQRKNNIMDDQPGPSGAGNSTLGKSVEETQELFNTGVACIRVRMNTDVLINCLLYEVK